MSVKESNTVCLPCVLHVGTYTLIPYSGKFLYGVNFCVLFRMLHPLCENDNLNM
jgi:hypothetical protein